jgi:branched-chain amino acid transport system permease protein
MFVQLVERRSFLFGVRAACKACLPGPPGLARISDADLDTLLDHAPQLARLVDRSAPLAAQRHALVNDLAVGAAPHWMVQANYVVSAVLSLAVSVFVVWAFYRLVIKRFNQAPRLVLTVVTIASGFAIDSVASFILSTFFSANHVRYGEGAPPPVSWSWKVHPATLHPAEVLTVFVAGAAVVGLVLFFRRSALGVALRGAAENAPRAQTLGINVDAVTGRAWTLAGGLAALASMLGVAGAASVTSSTDQLVRMLAAAAIGAFISLPATVFGALAVGVMDQSFVWHSHSNDAMVGVLLVLVVGVLLVQRARRSRSDVEADSTWEASREVRPIPDELRRVPSVRRSLAVVGALAAVWVLGYPWVMSPSQTNLAVGTMALGVIGLSLLVLTGWAGQISLGQMGFAAVGGWVALASGLPLVVGLVAGGVVAGVCAVAVGVPALRLRGLHVAVTTLAFGVAVTALVLDRRHLGSHVPTSVSRPVLLGVSLEDGRVFYYFTLALVALAVAGVAGMRRSRTGRVLIASKDNELAAETFGISIRAARLRAFAISGFMAGVAGAVMAYGQHTLDPSTYSPARSLDIFLVTIIGGMGSIAGPLLGAGYRGAVQLLASSPFAAYIRLFLDPGLGVLFVFMVLPGGFTQLVFGMRDAWLRRLASRLHIDVPSLAADREWEPGERLPMAPKLWPSSTLPMFVPERYRLDRQWGREARARERARA